MGQYQKINTLYKRDSNNIIIPNEYSLPEFKYLENCMFECTEKIDGTNMHIELDFTESDVKVEYKGKTDNANIPTHLFNRMRELFDNVDWTTIFNCQVGDHISIYGEGYGVKIQNGGNYIRNGVDFILFDVRVNKWWLNREALEDIASKLNIKIVPLIGYKTIPEAVDCVKKGFKSLIAENKDYDAEGLILKTPWGLCMRNGERLVLKIKTCDFRKYVAKYGENKLNEALNG